MSGPDTGRAQERTALAWQRTGLALLLGAVTVARLALDHLGPAVVVPAAVSAAAALWVVTRGSRGRQPASVPGADPTHRPGFAVLRDGRMPAVVAATLAALALGEVVAALASAL